MSKEIKGFGYACFPVGTVCEVLVESMHKVPIVITVAALVKNGPQSYVIVDKDNEGNIGGYNIQHVIRILKRGPGAAVIEDYRMIHGIEDERKMRWYDYEVDLRDTGKHWVTVTPAVIVNRLIKPFLTQDMMVDQAKLMGELRNAGLLSHSYNQVLCTNVFKLSKKKIKSKLRRILSKSLLRHKTAQREEEMMSEAFSYADSFDDRNYDMEEPATIADSSTQSELPV